MRGLFNTSLVLVSLTALMGCGEGHVPSEGENQDGAIESPDISQSESADEASIFTTIYCKLSTMDGNTSTYTTYFKYDETTVNYPSDTDIQHSPYLANKLNREHWKNGHGKYRLIDVSIELPTAAAKSAFKADAKNMYYMHGQSWQFFKPRLKSDGGWFEFSSAPIGHFVFGERTGPEDFAGHLEFVTGNQYGAVSSGKNGSVGSWSYNGKLGFINLCGSKSLIEEAR